MNYKQLERVVKGFASHRRLQILELLRVKPDLSVDQISEELNIGYMNTSDHIRKLAFAGLVGKRNEGPRVRHSLTPRGKDILVFCKRLK